MNIRLSTVSFVAVWLAVVVLLYVFLSVPNEQTVAETAAGLHVRLANGRLMPRIGIGTAAISATQVCDVIGAAEEIGLALVDTAAERAPWYRNEAAVGDCLASRGTRRRWFVTTKLFPADHGPRAAVRAVQASLRNLRVESIDLLLFHYAECWGDVCDRAQQEGTWQQSWRALSPFVLNGTVRAMGVSNFSPHQLDELLVLARETLVPLSVVQGWCDVLHSASNLRRWCERNGVHFQAYSPLGGQRWKETPNPVLTHPAIEQIARHRRITAAQVVLAWLFARNMSAVPRTTHANHLRANFESTKVILSGAELEQLDKLGD
jgi:diketogulonate reductase-like aldo/keto reductase